MKRQRHTPRTRRLKNAIEGGAMDENFEAGILIRYLRNLLSGPHLPPAAIHAIHSWIDEESVNLDLQEIEGWTDIMGSVFDAKRSRDQSYREIKRMKESFLPFLEDRLTQINQEQRSVIERNIHALSEAFNLDDGDRELLGLLVRYKAVPAVENLCDALTRCLPPHRCVSLVLGVGQRELLGRLDPSSRLVVSGIVKSTRNFTRNNIENFADVSEELVHAVMYSAGGIEKIQEFILGQPQTAELSWEDFSHLGNTARNLAAFLSRTLEQGSEGANIMIYGTPGTGKTEFAKVLAAEINAALYSVAEFGADGDEPTRWERMSMYQMGQTFLAGHGRAVLLFDEMEDMFQDVLGDILRKGRAAGSKVYLNRILEKNSVPVIWIINDPSKLEESIIRRMAFALEMKVPSTNARREILTRILNRYDVKLEDEEVNELAGYEDIPPGVVDSAVRMVKLTGGTGEDIRIAARSVIRAMTGGRDKPPEINASGLFDPSLVNADLDVKRLVEQLTTAGSSNPFSLCLYGPPGTGKTAFVRYLAERIGMEVLVRRASDILGMFVGQTEAAIASAFREAREDRKFLVFDEADSLIGDRKGAHRSWEITQVNEMLTWMESHPLPFACTTNLMDHLDEASLRRFTFKVGFDFLQAEQVKKAWQLFFKSEAPGEITELSALTPGDLAVVQRKAQMLGCMENSGMIINFLRAEVNIKKAEIKVGGFSRS